jgi:hypothetical protein
LSFELGLSPLVIKKGTSGALSVTERIEMLGTITLSQVPTMKAPVDGCEGDESLVAAG